MKRYIVFFSVLLCMLLCVCWKSTLGLVAQSALSRAFGVELVYSSLHRQDGAFVFQGVELVHDQTVVLSSAKVSVHIESLWPFQGTIDVVTPDIVLSKDLVNNFSIPKTVANGRWSVRCKEGYLRWSDGLLPDGQVSFEQKGEKISVAGTWDRRSLSVDVQHKQEKLSWNTVANEFPLEWVSRVSSIGCSGELTGFAQGSWGPEGLENLNVDATGKNLSVQWKQLGIAGDISLQAEMTDKELHRFRLLVEDGELLAPQAALQDIHVLATFHEAGTKWECKALATTSHGGKLPFEMRGKEVRFQWVEGTWYLGEATGVVSRDAEWCFSWDRIGVSEMAVIQGIAAALQPQLDFGPMKSGTLSGMIVGPAWKDLAVATFMAENLEWNTGRCEKLECKEGVWTVTKGKVGSYDFEGQWDTNSSVLELAGEGPGPWGLVGSVTYRDGRVTADSLEGEIDGIRFLANGAVEPFHQWAFTLDVPQFSGEVPSWVELFSRGHIASLQSGVHLQGHWSQTLHLTERNFALRFSEAAVPLGFGARLDGLCGELYVSKDEIDLVAVEGVCVFPLGNTTISQPIAAPRFRLTPQTCAFDVRLQGPKGDLARFVGTSTQLDPKRSHVLGQPIEMRDLVFDKQGLVSVFARMSLKEGVHAEGQFSRDGASRATIALDRWTYQGIEAPLTMALNYKDKTLNVTDCSWGDLHVTCRAIFGEKSVQIEQGRATLSTHGEVAFTGQVAGFKKVDLSISHGHINLSALAPDWKGVFEGKGCVTLSSEGIESDLDGTLEHCVVTNNGPLHVYFSSKTGALIHGVDAHWEKNLVQAKLVHFEPQTKHWRAEAAHVRAFDADLFGDLEGSLDLHSATGLLTEAFVPYLGAVRHAKNVHFFFDETKGWIEGLFAYRENWAKLSADIDFHSWKGRLILQQEESPGMTVQWFRDANKELFVESIEGTFGGVEASFHALDAKNPSLLIGSTRFDCARASDWIPEDIAKAFRELEMGKGFELKGHLSLDVQRPETIGFEGIFSGKQVELFGYQFRTLLGRTEIGAEKVRIHDLHISDSAGMMKIDEISLQTKDKKPWTIDIPNIVIHDLRPSLLHAPGEQPDPMTPLVIRQLTVRNLTGLLDEPKTYTAQGNVSFINSFKRQETVFDKPSNLFGRILGLDLELLIPVTGEVLFTLKDGGYRLHEAKSVYSEAKRSEFFLVEPRDFPHMDLDGNLNVQVQMKQFVIFKFTEAFEISIEGTLKKPEFRLQKKK